MNPSDILGTWVLEKFEIVSTAGERRPWGENLKGLLIYTADGHVSVSINKAPINMGSDKDFSAQEIFDSILFYAGTYSAFGNKIVHQVTIASSPKRIGQEMIRFANFSDNVLTLTTPNESFGKAILIWRKIHA